MWRLAPLEDVWSDIHSPAQFHVRGPTNGPIRSQGLRGKRIMTTAWSVGFPGQGAK